MATTLFTEQENGNLKLIAEVDIDNVALAVDALLDESPRLKDREFIALVGSTDGGTFTRVVVENDEPINPRRAITVAMNGNEVEDKPAPKRRGRPPKAAAAEPGADAPKRRGRPPGTKNKPKDEGAVKIDGRTKEGRAARAAASKPGPKPRTRTAASKKASPFKRNAASDE